MASGEAAHGRGRYLEPAGGERAIAHDPAYGRRMRWIAALTFALAGCAATAASPPTPAPTPPPTPRLVVLVVIDQWPSWGVAERRAHYRAGLARLLDGGVHFARAQYPFAITFTSPGHAALGTGASPRVTGVVANTWFRRGDGVERAAEHDPASPVLGLGGERLPIDGASGAILAVDGLAEALRAGTGGRGRSVAIAGKARAACFVAGRRPDVALWYEPAAGGFTSSLAYGGPPTWAAALAPRVAGHLDAVWTIDDPATIAAATGGVDDGPGETEPRFPHPVASLGDPAKALRLTPFLDTLTVDAALAAIAGEGLGADDVPDLLALSFSAHDYVGHQWGQESWEMFDLERRLDRELGRLLDALDRQVGVGRYAVVMTSDHGATRMPDRTGGARIAPAAIEAAAEAAAATVLGPGDWVAAVSSAMIYGSPTWAAAAPAARDAALAAMARAVEAVPGVHAVVPMATTTCAGQDDMVARVCETTVPGQTGELLVWPEDGGLVTSYAKGTSHDAPSDDDRTVPVVVVGPGLAPRTVAAPVSALAVAATVAALLGVAPPDGAAPALPLAP
jgi:drug/metabolite transporter (DMT)-like permease